LSRRWIKEFWAIIWILCVCVLSLLPFIFFRRVIHNDLAVQALPLLIFGNDAFRSGTVPFWDPFQDCGVPHFSNPQSHLWYLPNQLVFWTSGYSLYSIQYEFIFHFLIAGLCFYLLARKFKLSQAGSCLASVSYMLSGFFIGHSEHMNILATFAWLPLILAGIQGWLDEKSPKNLWLSGIGFWLLIQGGNPSANLIAFFFIGLFLLVRLAERIYDRGFNLNLFREFSQMLLVFIIAFLISGISIVPILADFSEYTGRQQGIPYQTALEFNPLKPWELITLILPSASLSGIMPAFNETGSPTMINCYFGLISLALALFAIYVRRDRSRLILLSLGLFALLIALGSRAIFRGLLFELVPFLRMLKHPALFRGAFILFFCILAGMGLDDLIQADNSALKEFRRAVLLLVVSLCLIFGFASVVSFALTSRDQETAMLLKDIFLETLPIQIALLIALYFWLRSKKNFWSIGILFLASLDLSLMVQANMPLMGQYLDQRTRKILIESVENRSRKIDHITNLTRIDNWRLFQNNGMLYKKFETSDYTSINSITYEKIMNTGFHKVIAEAPFFFIVPAVSMIDQMENALPIFSRAAQKNLMPAMVSEEPPLEIKVRSELLYALESLDSRNVRVINYSINRVELQITNQAPAVLGTTEAFHPGWRAWLDNKPVKTIRFNFAFRGIYLPDPGTHILIWKFQPKSFYLGVLVSSLGIISLGSWILICFLFRKL